MDNSLMIGLSTQQLLRQRMDVTSNNLANMNTTGFKVEDIIARPLSERPAQATENPGEITFAEGWRLQRDMSTGPIQRTGNPFDAAINGEGFFTVQGANGEEFYTRDGRFSLNAEGNLVTRSGSLVTAPGGAPIQLDPEAGPISISKDGAISQNNAEVARLNVVAFDTPGALEKRGANLWAATDEQPRPPETLDIQQGSVEGSNVSPVVELTQMIEISRAYQSVAQMIKDSDSMREQAISKLSRVR